ncbi:MAG: ATPase, partial [Agromyces sp.]|nr:ATPase [Agromyces sp.]
MTTTISIPESRLTKSIGALGKAREFGILLALALVIAAATVKNPAFLFSADGWRDLLLTPSILLLVAVG